MEEKRRRARDAFIENLYQEMGSLLRILAARKLHNPDLAEEAVQNALVVLCEKTDTVMAHPNPQGWLVETLQFVVMSMNRKTDREISVIQGSLDDVQPHHHDDYHEVEFRPLLSPEDYELIEMTVVQRYTIPEAAEELGITVEACKKRKQRAILRMRERFLEKKQEKAET